MRTFGFLITLLFNLVCAQERFQFRNHFYNHVVYHTPDENIVVSTVAFESMLMQVYLGAEGKSKKELENVLLLEKNSDKSEVTNAFIDFYKQSMQQYPKALRTASIIIVNKKFKLVDHFAERVKPFNTRVDRARIYKGNQICKKLNQWFRNKTGNKIQAVFGTKSIKETSSVIFGSGMYFKDKWVYSFDKSQTNSENFYMSSGNVTEVRMMTNYGLSVRYGHLPNSNVEVVQLPLQTGLNMVFLLPAENGLPELELKLLKNSINIPKVVENLKQHDAVAVTIPKFKIEFILNLKSILENMGVTGLFEEADLSSMIKDDNSLNPPTIYPIRHTSVIAVDEGGVETIDEKINGPERPHFLANRPFMFAICDSETVHFYGRVVEL